MDNDAGGKSALERVVRPLRPYMCYCGDAADGAVLAWAHTAQDARKLAYPAIADWTDCGFIDVRANLLTKHPAYYETLKLREGPHVNGDPPVCPVCELWGSPPLPDGRGCEFCGVDDPGPNGQANLPATRGPQEQR